MASREEVIEGITTIEKRCRGPLSEDARATIRALLLEATEESIAEAKKIDSVARPRCGYDFNEIILSGPLDGKEHSYECPKCGVKGVYTPPLADE
jgi:predicted RNA-binding Zn-ribbon protein involved in translation (DUF1610 family)